MRKWVVLLLVVAASLFGLAALAQESGAINIAFIFDASGSMMAGMEGRTRLAVAQDALAELSSNLPANANTSLWVYGHRLPQDDPAASCQDIEQVIPLGPADPASFQSAVRGIQAIGYTPITDSLQLAAQTLVDRPDDRNTIVLISDGEETCGGSPCLMAQAIKAANIEMTVNTIGFAADAVTRQQLECIAEVTGGTYYDAQDSGQLIDALQAAVAPPGTVRTVDGAGEPLADVAFQVLDTAGQPVGSYVGTATVAGGDYRAVVPGEPVVDVTITVVPGEVTDVVVDRPDLGTIRMVDENGNPLEAQLFSAANAETGEGPAATGSLKVPPGLYTVTIYTTFPYEEQVTVNLNEVTDVVVHDDTGTLRMVDDAGNLLDSQLFSLVNATTQQSASATGSMDLPSGSYTVTIYTVFPYDTVVDITAGETTDVVVNTAAGTVRMVDANGQPLDSQLFSVTSTTTGESTASTGSKELPPGTYTVEVFTVFPFTLEVDVTAGETTDVTVSTETGTLQMVDETGALLPSQLFTVTNTATNESTAFTGSAELPPGHYSVEVFTLFPFTVEVDVAGGQTTPVEVSTEAGTIQLVDQNGAALPSLLFSFTNTATGDSSASTGTQDVPPGTYALSIYTVFPIETEVTVAPGEITPVEVDTSAGTVRMVDGKGSSQASTLFTITRQSDGASTAATGSIDVPPGVYSVNVLTDKSFTVNLEVVDGEVTTVNIINATTDRPAN
ncbi:MAG: VWA domain-containing protein [Anaerolineae bacterium]